jgi:hypothetical protein
MVGAARWRMEGGERMILQSLRALLLVLLASVASTARAGEPSWLVLCLDRSGSIGPAAIAEMKTALAKALVDGAPSQLPFNVGVIAFGTRSTHLLTFTNQTAQVAAAIERLAGDREAAGKTKLNDAIAGGLATLRAEGEGSKRLIVVSDGKDEGSVLSAARLAELAQMSPPIPIDAVSFGSLSAAESGALSTVAGSTGGRFIQAANAKELGDGLKRLIAGMTAAPLRVAPVPAPAPPIASHPVPSPPDHWLSVKISVLLKYVRMVPSFAWAAGAALALALGLLGRRVWVAHHVVIVEPPPPVAPPPGVTVTFTKPPPAPPPRRAATQLGFAWPEPRSGQPAAILRGVSGTMRGEQFAMDKPLFHIGCSPDNDVVLVGDDFASGHHAILRAQAHALYVEDLGSLNGSYLNGAPFKSATRALSPGDELKFGHTTLEVLSVEAVGQRAHSGFEPRVK